MSETKYTYSVATDTANALLAPDSLSKQIRESEILISLASVTALGDVLDITFRDALIAGDKTILDSVVGSHDGKPIDNEYIQKVQTHIGAVGIKLLEFGFTFTATKDSTTNGDVLLPVKYLRGAGVEAEYHFFGDDIGVQIVDKDNVLGYGAGAVLDQFGKDIPVPSSGLFKVLSESISNALPDGLYFRVVYKSVGTALDVNVRVQCRGYNDV